MSWRERLRLSPKAAVPVAILAAGAVALAIMIATRPETVPQPREVPTPIIEVVEVVPEDVQYVVRAQGTVVPRTESDLVAQVAGEVEWVSPYLAAGGFFEAGEPLVRLDPVDAEADLESARAALARAESEYRRAHKERDRQRRLADRSVASQSRIDDAENQFRVAEAVQREARARLGKAERDLERTTLRAPFDGRVRSERVDVGQFVARGQSLATLYAVDYAEVRLPLPDRELGYVDLPLANRRVVDASSQPAEAAGTDDADASDAAPTDDVEPAPNPEASGPAVILRADFAGGARSWPGTIVRTEGEIDPRSRMVHVVARVEDPYGRNGHREGGEDAGAPGPDDAWEVPLAVGLFVEAEIMGRTVRDAVVLPRAALREHEGRTGVYVVDAESRLRFRPVEVLRLERETVVLGGGLERGERVNVSPLAAIVDGMRVRVAEEAPRALAASDPGAAAAAEPDGERAAP